MTDSTYALAVHARQYATGRMPRPQADPLGSYGLPAERHDLDALVGEFANEVKVAGVGGIRGSLLARLLGLKDTCQLRALVAYARVHHRMHQIVGAPGRGYFWGDCAPLLYSQAIRDATRRGRCYLFIAALHKRLGPAVAAAQMVLEFMNHGVAAADRHDDELAAMVAAEGTTTADLLEAIIEMLAASDEGRAALAAAGQRHVELLISQDTLAGIVGEVDALRGKLASLLQPTRQSA